MTKLGVMLAAGLLALSIATSALATAPPGRRADARYGPDCWEGAPRSEDNIDCPLPLRTGGDDDRWDDLFQLGLTMRLGYAPTSMGGIGFAGRTFAARYVAFDVGADVLGGVDPNGDRRTEIPISADALLFFHRGSRVHGYLLGGGFVSFARTQSDPEQIERESYYGPRLGFGFELMGARDLGWSFDLVGFERIELDGDATLAGSAALLRISATFYVHD